MANHSSSKKRIRSNDAKRDRNKYYHKTTRNALKKVRESEDKKEIVESVREIEKQLGVKVKHFAFPNGRPRDFNDELKKYCQEIGLMTVGTCDYGHNKSKEDNFELKRIGSELPLGLFALNLVRAFGKS